MPAKRKAPDGSSSREVAADFQRRLLTGKGRPVFTARSAVAYRAPIPDREEIAKMRGRLKLSQTVFAQALNVSADTVRAWEQGKRVPEGAAARLLQFVRDNPDWLLREIRHSRGPDES